MSKKWTFRNELDWRSRWRKKVDRDTVLIMYVLFLFAVQDWRGLRKVITLKCMREKVEEMEWIGDRLRCRWNKSSDASLQRSGECGNE